MGKAAPAARRSYPSLDRKLDQATHQVGVLVPNHLAARGHGAALPCQCTLPMLSPIRKGGWRRKKMKEETERKKNMITGLGAFFSEYFNGCGVQCALIKIDFYRVKS